MPKLPIISGIEAIKVKGVSSKRLRDESQHFKEWCGDHLWAPSCFHDSVGNGWEVIERYIQTRIHTMEKTICTGLGLSPGFVTEDDGRSRASLGYLEP